MATPPDEGETSNEDDTFYYRMTAVPKGICVIINNRNFGTSMPERRGTDKDKESLFETFTHLKFEVELHENLNATGMIDVMIKLSQQNHSQYDCVVVCILSHGCLGCVFGTNGERVLIKDLTNVLKPQFCATLAGKPKLFFIQACQGPDRVPAYPSMERDVEIAGDEELIPNESDILLSYSTVPGYQSFRDTKDGSVFINCLTNCLRKYARTKDILDILTIVNNEVCKRLVDMGGDGQLCGQCPNPSYTLRKKVLLGSGIEGAGLPEEPFTRNLSRAEGDCDKEREPSSDDLFKGRPSSGDVSCRRHSVRYVVTVKVTPDGDKPLSGVFVIKLFGIRGATKDIELTDAKVTNQNSTLEFEVKTVDVSPLKILRVAFKSEKVKMKAQLAKIELKNMATRTLTVFHHNEPLGMDSVDIRGMERDEDVLKETIYKISVFTSSCFQAGTDANVYIIMFGSNGESTQLHLEKSETNKDPFERGHTDVFTTGSMLSLGELYRVRVWHDNKKLGADWHLSKIEVKDRTTQRSYTFKCDGWLSDSKKGRLIRELTCSCVSGPETIVYEIEVKTAQEENSGTNHSAWLILKGTKSTSDAIMLDTNAQRSILQRGQTDNFTHTAVSYGSLESCTVGCYKNKRRVVHAEPGKPVDWQCYEVVVTDTSSGIRTRFPCQRWLSPEKHAMPHGVECQKGQEEDTFWAKVKKLGVVIYMVEVCTGDCDGAGTDANVFITIFGDHGDTGKRPLKKQGRNLFERRQSDLFELEAVDLGALTSVRIEHDSSGLMPDWFLDHVKVTNTNANASYTFPCSKWLSRERGVASKVLQSEASCRPRE